MRPVEASDTLNTFTLGSAPISAGELAGGRSYAPEIRLPPPWAAPPLPLGELFNPLDPYSPFFATFVDETLPALGPLFPDEEVWDGETLPGNRPMAAALGRLMAAGARSLVGGPDGIDVHFLDVPDTPEGLADETLTAAAREGASSLSAQLRCDAAKAVPLSLSLPAPATPTKSPSAILDLPDVAVERKNSLVFDGDSSSDDDVGVDVSDAPVGKPLHTLCSALERGVPPPLRLLHDALAAHDASPDELKEVVSPLAAFVRSDVDEKGSSAWRKTRSAQLLAAALLARASPDEDTVDTMVNLLLAVTREGVDPHRGAVRAAFAGFERLAGVMGESHAHRLVPAVVWWAFRDVACVEVLQGIIAAHPTVLSSLPSEISKCVAQAPPPRGTPSPLTALLFAVSYACCTTSPSAAGYARSIEVCHAVVREVVAISFSPVLLKDRSERLRVTGIVARLASDLVSDPFPPPAPVLLSVLASTFSRAALAPSSPPPLKSVAIAALGKIARTLLTQATPPSATHGPADHLRLLEHTGDTPGVNFLTASLAYSATKGTGSDTETAIEVLLCNRDSIHRASALARPLGVWREELTKFVEILGRVVISTGTPVAARRLAVKELGDLLTEAPAKDKLVQLAVDLMKAGMRQPSPLLREASLHLVPVVRRYGGVGITKDLLVLLEAEQSVSVLRRVLAILGDIAKDDVAAREHIVRSVLHRLAPAMSTTLAKDLALLIERLWADSPLGLARLVPFGEAILPSHPFPAVLRLLPKLRAVAFNAAQERVLDEGHLVALMHAIAVVDPAVGCTFPCVVILGTLLSRDDPHAAFHAAAIAARLSVREVLGDTVVMQHLVTPLLRWVHRAGSVAMLATVLEALCTRHRNGGVVVSGAVLRLFDDCLLKATDHVLPIFEFGTGDPPPAAPALLLRLLFVISEGVRGGVLEAAPVFDVALRVLALDLAQLRAGALRVLGGVCRRDPVTYFRRARPMLEQGLKEGGKCAQQVLDGLTSFLLEEAAKSEVEAATGAEVDTGLGGELAQTYLPLASPLALEADDLGAVGFIGTVIDFGLCSPVLVTDTLVALLPHPVHSGVAEGHLTTLVKRFPHDVLSRVAAGVAKGIEPLERGVDEAGCSRFHALSRVLHLLPSRTELHAVLAQIARLLHDPEKVALPAPRGLRWHRVVAEALAFFPFTQQHEVLSLVHTLHLAIELRVEQALTSRSTSPEDWVHLVGLWFALALKEALRVQYRITAKLLDNFATAPGGGGRRFQKDVSSYLAEDKAALSEFAVGAESFYNTVLGTLGVRGGVTQRAWKAVREMLEKAAEQDAVNIFAYTSTKAPRGRKRRRRSSTTSTSEDSESSEGEGKALEGRRRLMARRRKQPAARPRRRAARQRWDVDNLASSSSASSSS